MFTISASSTAARPTVVAHRRANKTRAKRSVVVHGAKVRERASARRARASTGGRRTGRGDGDRAGRLLEGFGARARGADESDV
jgi:hypothetical protein